MKKIFAFILCFLSLPFSCLTLSGCKTIINQNSERKVMIDDINYTSLREAVESAKNGDKIVIYNDVYDNKNIVINKSLSIVGKTNSSKIKPNFFGSLTVDINDQNGTLNIENIQIINPGKYDTQTANNTLDAINLIDGGLSVKNCKIMPDEDSDSKSCGIIISRKIDSVNNMPINISGNYFGSYKYDGELNSAIVIKNNKSGELKNLNLNCQLIKSQNSFDNATECNNIIEINYSQSSIKYPFIISSSTIFMIDCLKNDKQSTTFNNYYLINPQNYSHPNDEPIYILPSTALSIFGNGNADWDEMIFKTAGNVFVDAQIQNVTFERTSDTSCIILGKNVDENKITIK